MTNGRFRRGLYSYIVGDKKSDSNQAGATQRADLQAARPMLHNLKVNALKKVQQSSHPTSNSPVVSYRRRGAISVPAPPTVAGPGVLTDEQRRQTRRRNSQIDVLTIHEEINDDLSQTTRIEDFEARLATEKKPPSPVSSAAQVRAGARRESNVAFGTGRPASSSEAVEYSWRRPASRASRPPSRSDVVVLPGLGGSQTARASIAHSLRGRSRLKSSGGVLDPAGGGAEGN